jgi:ATP-dependent HslUV protease ATP-binding subunit HslU
MGTESVDLSFTADGIKRIAELAWQVNEKTENIGARRLHTLLERLLEDISYEAGEESQQKFIIDEDYVSQQLSELVQDEDLSRYIL